MDAEIKTYAGLIDDLLEKAGQRAASLSMEAVNWEPLDADTNSVGALATHVCGVARSWVLQGIAGEDIGRQRDSEFIARVDANGEVNFWGTSRPLADVLSETRALVAEVLAGMQPSALAETNGFNLLGPRTNRWALVHVVDEIAQHIGHMDLTIQFWNARVS